MSHQPHSRRSSTCSLLVYGSLMDRRELAGSGVRGGSTIPVMVSGLCREFSQEPSWRVGTGSDRGVLTVRRAAGCRINAVLVTNLPIKSLAALDRRERGYVRRLVRAEHVSPFEPGVMAAWEEDIFSYEGRPELYNPALRPNSKYLSLCVDAAAVWGERFRRMFLQTTLAAGRPLGPAHG